MKQLVWLFCFFIFGFGICSCAGCRVNFQEEDFKKEICVVTYNTQEFFDAVKDGCEYSEFKKSSDWGTEKYKIRLERLCTVIKSLNADIYILQEIENEAVLQDISNFLAGESWRQKDLWSYSCFSKEPDSAIGNAVFSRYPLENVKNHGIDIRSEEENQPSVRPLMQVTVNTGEEKLEIFVNHWKSKSGGKEETEKWRDWQEKVLADVLIGEKEVKSDFKGIICGDFNRDIFDFEQTKDNSDLEGNIILRGSKGNFKVKSLWIDNNGKLTSSTGSYFYDEAWERIDHIFFSGDFDILEFGPQYSGDWVDENGMPKRYRLYSGQGYSDHLPVKAVFRIKK